jgi:hypothetical protein
LTEAFALHCTLHNLLHRERNEVQLFWKNSHVQMTLATKMFVLIEKHLAAIGMLSIWKMKLQFPFFIVFRNFHWVKIILILRMYIWCGVFLLLRREVFLRTFTLEPCFWNFCKHANVSPYNNIKVKKKMSLKKPTHELLG